jgi:hypothetical protein
MAFSIGPAIFLKMFSAGAAPAPTLTSSEKQISGYDRNKRMPAIIVRD